MTTTWTEFRLSRQEKRRNKAKRWREENLTQQIGWRTWDGNDHYGRKLHIPGKTDRHQTDAWCGIPMWAQYYIWDYGTEFDSWVAEEPEPLTAENVCKRCCAAIRKDGTHPRRRRNHK